MKKHSKLLGTITSTLSVVIMTLGLSHGDNRVNRGNFVTTAAGTAAGYTIAGTAVMARRGDSVTFVTTHVTGLKRNAYYGSHLHILPCNMGGGAHYKTNPADSTTQASNEIWPMLRTDTSGTANGFVSTPYKVRPEGQSIVIHDTTAGKEKIACVDLIEAETLPVTYTGTFKKFVDTTTLQGTASMVKNGGSTVISITVTGLLPNTAYGCHVHVLPGTVQSAGGHYKIDPLVTTTVETNEVWLNFTTDGMGMATKSVTSANNLRPEAQSIVIHAPSGTKLGWADLLPPTATSLASSAIISGALTTTAVGTTAGYTNMKGQGLIVRANGATVAALSVTGLVKNKTYGSHLHDKACTESFGGGHYKIDPSIATVVESNEIWTMLTTDTAGAATGFGLAAAHIAGPTAISIVIHDTVSSARIGCVDLKDMAVSIKPEFTGSTNPNSMIDLGFNTFRIQAAGDFSFHLYTVRGKQVLSHSGTGSQILNLDGLAKGHYFSRIHIHGNAKASMTQGLFIK